LISGRISKAGKPLYWTLVQWTVRAVQGAEERTATSGILSQPEQSDLTERAACERAYRLVQLDLPSRNPHFFHRMAAAGILQTFLLDDIATLSGKTIGPKANMQAHRVFDRRRIIVQRTLFP